MTTIACCGRYLAADTRGSYGNCGIVQLPSRKLSVRDNVAFASTGRIGDNWREALIDWWVETGGDVRVAAMPFKGHDDNDPGAFIICDSEDFPRSLTYATPWANEHGTSCAWGTGADYAIGAMEMGADAMKAVQVAMKHDGPSGGDIEFIDLEDIERGVQLWEPETNTARPVANPGMSVNLQGVRDPLLPDPFPGKNPMYEMLRDHGNINAMRLPDPVEDARPPKLDGYADIVDGYHNIHGDQKAIHCVHAHDENQHYAYREFRTGPCNAERHATTQLRGLLHDYVNAVNAPKGTTIAWRIVPELMEQDGKWKGYARLAICYDRDMRKTGGDPHDGSVVVVKPSKAVCDPNGLKLAEPTWWHMECTGLLAQDTGCGHCLRCNREWHVLKKQPHEVVNYAPDVIRLWSKPVTKAEALDLDAWVQAWNAASVRAQMHEIGRLEAMLRTMDFPDSVELITEYDNSVSGWQKRIIYGETAE